MSWEGFEMQRESARAIRAEVYDIASALYEREENSKEWVAQSYIMVERLKAVIKLLKNLQWGLYLGLSYDNAPKEAVIIKDCRGVHYE